MQNFKSNVQQTDEELAELFDNLFTTKVPKPIPGMPTSDYKKYVENIMKNEAKNRSLSAVSTKASLIASLMGAAFSSLVSAGRNTAVSLGIDVAKMMKKAGALASDLAKGAAAIAAAMVGFKIIQAKLEKDRVDSALANLIDFLGKELGPIDQDLYLLNSKYSIRLSQQIGGQANNDASATISKNGLSAEYSPVGGKFGSTRAEIGVEGLTQMISTPYIVTKYYRARDNYSASTQFSSDAELGHSTTIETIGGNTNTSLEIGVSVSNKYGKEFTNSIDSVLKAINNPSANNLLNENSTSLGAFANSLNTVLFNS